MKITLHRTDNNFQMRAVNELGKTVDTDAGPATGGHDAAMRPMQMVLAALGGCSSIDIIYLLRKQRRELDDLKVEITAERREEEPRVFTSIHVHYRLIGEVEDKKAERACRLSMEKMCSVSMMLKPTVAISWSYTVEAEA
ncbi:MAG: OsmC family protein [Saprospiraceae bacterium]